MSLFRSNACSTSRLGICLMLGLQNLFAQTTPEQTPAATKARHTPVSIEKTSSFNMEELNDKTALSQKDILKRQQQMLQHLKNAKGQTRDQIIAMINRQGSQLLKKGPYQGMVTRSVTVKAGDSLSVIARRHQCSKEAIAFINDLERPDLIYPKMKLLVPKFPSHVKVFKQRFEMELYFGAFLCRVYSVGLGAEGMDTPIGETRVSNSRAIHPSYTDRKTNITYPYGDPLNPVGSRWIGLTMGNGYGIHGTDEPHSIGKAMSHGCVRMKKADLEELYDFLLPQHRVSILP